MDATGEQLALPGDDFDLLTAGKELLTLDAIPEQDRYPGSTFEKLTVRRDEILRAMAEGESLRAIGRVYRVGYYTLKSLQDRAREEIAARKERLSRKAELAAELCIDRLIEEHGSIPIQQVPIAAGIMLDKSLTLRGEASSFVEHRDRPRAEDFEARLKKAREEFMADAIPVTAGPAMGLEGREDGAKGAAGGPGSGIEGAEERAVDSESVGSEG